MTAQIGWTITHLDYAIAQGSCGGQRLTYRVTDASGGALPDYDGWACAIVIMSPFNGNPVINMSPTVTGDAGAMTLAFDMYFTESTTANLAAGEYSGGVTMTDPTGLTYKNPSITLTIQSGFGS